MDFQFVLNSIESDKVQFLVNLQFREDLQSIADLEGETILPANIFPLCDFQRTWGGTLQYHSEPETRFFVQPLHLAAAYGQKDAVSLLLKFSDIDRQPEGSGATALFLALLCGHLDTAKMLLDEGAHPGGSSGYNAIHAAARQGFKDEIARFVNGFDVDPDIEDTGGATPVVYALLLKEEEAWETISLLFSLGARRKSPAGCPPYADLAQSMGKTRLAAKLAVAADSSDT